MCIHKLLGVNIYTRCWVYGVYVVNPSTDVLSPVGLRYISFCSDSRGRKKDPSEIWPLVRFYVPLWASVSNFSIITLQDIFYLVGIPFSAKESRGLVKKAARADKGGKQKAFSGPLEPDGACVVCVPRRSKGMKGRFVLEALYPSHNERSVSWGACLVLLQSFHENQDDLSLIETIRFSEQSKFRTPVRSFLSPDRACVGYL